jgi:predicted nucleic acid-binding protein
MIAVDTNVLVRLVLADDPRQAALVRRVRCSVFRRHHPAVAP